MQRGNPRRKKVKLVKKMDTIGNFLTSIRNASSKGLEKTDVSVSKIRMVLAKILKEEGFIQSYRLMEENHVPFLRIQLKYTDKHEPVMIGIKRVSRPGLRIYNGTEKLPRVDGGLGVAIVSTSKGMMTNKKARQLKLGGEIICHVW